MASYVVMEPPEGSDRSVDETVFVRDGFAFLAFLVPLLWFLWHRMWIETLAILAVMLILGGFGSLAAWPGLSTIVSLCLSLLIGLEAGNLRIAMLRRRGWRMNGVVEAGSRSDAEMRYIAELHDSEKRDMEPAAMPTLPPATADRAGDGPALGLFSYPGAR